MKKSLSLTLLVIISFASIKAQFDIKDYLDYENPDLKRHELTVEGLLNNFSNHSYYGDTSIINRSDFTFFNKFNVTYTFTKNTRKYQGFQFFSLTESHQFSNAKEIKETQNKLFIIDSEPYFNSQNRFYLKKKWFYELNISGNYDFEFIKNYHYSPEDSNFKNNYYRINTFEVSPGLSFGKGRIEDITDVIHAIVLVKNLKNNNRIDEYPSPEKIKDLSRFMAQIKNERFFDSRHKKIFELEQIDSFLTVNNLINNKDIKYFTTIEDIWVFAGNYERTYGSRIKIDLNTNYRNALSKHTSNLFGVPAPYNHLYISPGISYLYTKPVNVKIQSILDISLGYRYSITKYNNDEYDGIFQTEHNYKDIFADINYSYNYYPNTRTVIQSGLSLSYNNLTNNYIFDSQSYSFEVRNIPLDISLIIDCKYYISPQVRLTIDGNIQYQYEKYGLPGIGNKFFNYQLLAGLQISLK